MHWRFLTEEGIKVSTTALQEPCCVDKFSIAMLMPAPLPPDCPQQHWTGRTGRLQSSSQPFVFGGHENLLGNLQQTISSHFMVMVTCGMEYYINCKTLSANLNIGHDYFYLIWVDSKYETIITLKSHWYQICSMELVFHLRALSLLSEGWVFWKQYIKQHIFTFNTFVKYAARKSEVTLT